MMPSIDYEVAPVSDITHFMECDVSPAICPMRFEDLQVDITSPDRRHCKYCDKFVYKADNEYMVNKLQDEGKCMAISNTLLERMNGKMDERRYINLQNRLAVSKLFLVYKRYNRYDYERFIDNKLTDEEILKAIAYSHLPGIRRKVLIWILFLMK